MDDIPDTLAHAEADTEVATDGRDLQRLGYVQVPVLWMLKVLDCGMGPARVAHCLLFQGSVQCKRLHVGADFVVSVSHAEFERWGVLRRNVAREVERLAGLVEVVRPGTKAHPAVYRVRVSHLWTDIKPRGRPRQPDSEPS